MKHGLSFTNHHTTGLPHRSKFWTINAKKTEFELNQCKLNIQNSYRLYYARHCEKQIDYIMQQQKLQTAHNITDGGRKD